VYMLGATCLLLVIVNCFFPRCCPFLFLCSCSVGQRVGGGGAVWGGLLVKKSYGRVFGGGVGSVWALGVERRRPVWEKGGGLD